jgi:putative redox protein
MIARTEWKPTESVQNRFLAFSESGHQILFDATSAHTDGASPMEAVLMGLCGCTSADIVTIMGKKRQPMTSLTVSAVAEQQAEPPKYFNKIRLVYTIGGKVSRKAAEDALHLSKTKYCSVSAMLERAADITFELVFADGEPLP